MKCLEIEIMGRVQGVWFRKYTKDCADRLGIVGNVQNKPDGSVLCQAQGEELSIKEFLEFCHKGSPLSSVTHVIVTQREPLSSNCFEILR